MSFVEKVEQLNREFGATFDRAVSSLRHELQDRLRESHQELDRRIDAFSPPLPVLAHEDLAPAAEQVRGEARAGAFDELRQAFVALDRARSQSAVLAALLAGAGRFAARAAILLWRDGELRGWGGQGFADSEHALHDLALVPPAGSPWSRFGGHGASVATGAAEATPADAAAQLSAADCAVLCGRIESPVPAQGFLVPLVLRDRTVALLYADQPVSAQPAPPGQESAGVLPALQSLVYVAALAIESLPFRQRDATSTLSTLGEPGTAGPQLAPPPTSDASGEVQPAQAASQPSQPAAAQPSQPAAQPAQPAAAQPPRDTAGESRPAAAAGEAAEPRQRLDDTVETQRPRLAPPPPAAPTEAPPPAGPIPPLAVTPAALYDSPSVPLAQETAELPAPRPLRPARATVETSAVSHGASPYLEEPATNGGDPAAAAGAATADMPPPPAAPFAAPTPAAAAELGAVAAVAAAAGTGADAPAGGATDNETVLLPQTVRRDAEASPGPVMGTLRAVPPMAPAAAPPPTPLSTASLGAQPVAVPPPIPFSPAAPGAGAFEPLRTGPIGSGTPEVRPPTGVQGPGWAFATTRLQPPSSDEALHEEARRLARLLVSEIKLYNEEQVEAGRRNRDIYERLREDIDRSRQMYEERVEPRIVKSTDYFYQELVRILAAGDSKALGI
jgi:hypothetical protein